MPHKQTDLIAIKHARKKGRGVFARKEIKKGILIERVPVVILPVGEVWGTKKASPLADYVFNWEEDSVAVALGYGSLYNHSYEPNAKYYDVGTMTLVFEAIRDIKKGEEITINYNGPKKSKADVGFRVIGT